MYVVNLYICYFDQKKGKEEDMKKGGRKIEDRYLC